MAPLFLHLSKAGISALIQGASAAITLYLGTGKITQRRKKR